MTVYTKSVGKVAKTSKVVEQPVVFNTVKSVTENNMRIYGAKSRQSTIASCGHHVVATRPVYTDDEKTAYRFGLSIADNGWVRPRNKSKKYWIHLGFGKEQPTKDARPAWMKKDSDEEVAKFLSIVSKNAVSFETGWQKQTEKNRAKIAVKPVTETDYYARRAAKQQSNEAQYRLWEERQIRRLQANPSLKHPDSDENLPSPAQIKAAQKKADEKVPNRVLESRKRAERIKESKRAMTLADFIRYE